MSLFSRAGISVIESREYPFFIDLVIEKPLEPTLFKELYIELMNKHGVLIAQLRREKPVIRVLPYTPAQSPLYKYRYVLTATALVTIFATGYGLSFALSGLLSTPDTLGILANALTYTVVFTVVLLLHELGHVITSKRSGIPIEGPILLPAPPIQLGFLGTFGAIIFAKAPPPTRKDLAKLGLSGPLLGFIAATAVGILGVYLSPVISVSEAKALIESGALEEIRFASLSFYLLLYLRPLQPHEILVLHPILFVTYIVYLITFLNLLPVGQLDGGHVVQSVLEQKAFETISTVVPLSLIIAGLALSLMSINAMYYVGLGFVALLLKFITGRGSYPGLINQYDESSCKAYLLSYIALLMLTLPIPI